VVFVGRLANYKYFNMDQVAPRVLYQSRFAIANTRQARV
jgi:UDP-galactopyranose mutase